MDHGKRSLESRNFLKIRSAGFSNLQALRDMVVGSYIPDAVVILGSIDIVLGEIDR